MTNLIMCPHCGQKIDITPANLVDLHPNIARTWIILQHSLRRGQRVGVSAVAELAILSPQTAHEHLKALVAAGAVETAAKREGGKYKVYMLP